MSRLFYVDIIVYLIEASITFKTYTNKKITVIQLENVCSEIERYHDRFRNLLGPGNRRYIQTLIVLARAFLHTLLDIGSALNSSMAINDFLFSLNIDNINLVKLVRYIKESNIINKVKAQSY